MDLALQVLDLERFITCAIRISGVMVLQLSLSLSPQLYQFPVAFQNLTSRIEGVYLHVGHTISSQIYIFVPFTVLLPYRLTTYPLELRVSRQEP